MSNIETENEVAPTARGWKRFTITQELLKLGREYGTTFLTEFTALVSLLVTYKLAAHGLGKEGFSEYAVARRAITLIYPVLILGLHVALPRYIGCTIGNSNRSNRYYGAALWCVGSVTVISIGLIVLFQKGFAYLFFGASSFANLVFPLSLVIVGMTLHSIVYAYFRGRLEFKNANLLQLVNFGLVPVVAFFKFGTSVHVVLTAWGAGTTIIAAAAILLTPWRKAVASRSWNEVKELLSYGVQRLLGSFALMALMALPATFAVHMLGVQEGGFIAFGTSLLSTIAALFSPIGIILLPKASKMLADGAHAALREHVLRIVKLTVIAALGLTIGFETLASVMIRLYLGNDFSKVTGLVRIFALGALPYALFYVLHGLIDAYYAIGVNAVNCGYSLAIFLMGCVPALFYKPLVVIPWAFMLGIFSLGLLTVREARRILCSEGGSVPDPFDATKTPRELQSVGVPLD